MDKHNEQRRRRRTFSAEFKLEAERRTGERRAAGTHALQTSHAPPLW